MKIIIGWTGKTSRGMAELLRDWIMRVIQASEPILINVDEQSSSLFIPKRDDQGERFFGILCLTSNNHNDHSMLFEAGVMSNLLPGSRICGMMLDIEDDQICRPLKRFPLLDSSKEGVRTLLHSINESRGNKAIVADVLEDTFNIFWQKFEEQAEKLRQEASRESKTGEPERSREPVISNEVVMIEMLATVRALEKKLHHSPGKSPAVPEGSEDNTKPFQDSIVSLIEKMSESGYTEDQTIDFLKNIGIPESYTRYTVHKTLGTGVHMELHKK
jgi:hypothetical protein